MRYQHRKPHATSPKQSILTMDDFSAASFCAAKALDWNTHNMAAFLLEEWTLRGSHSKFGRNGRVLFTG